MRNVDRAYYNIEKLLTNTGCEISNVWDQYLDTDILKLKTNNGIYDIAGKCELETKELCLGDELTYVDEQSIIDKLARTTRVEVVLDILSDYVYNDVTNAMKEIIKENKGNKIKDSYNPYIKSNAKKVIEFFYDNEGSEIDVEDALRALNIDYERYGEYIDDLPDDVLSKVYYFLKKEYQKEIQRYGEDANIPEAAYDIFNLDKSKANISTKKLKDELLDTLLDFYRFNNVDLDVAEIDVKKRSNDCLKCAVQVDLDQENLRKLVKKLNLIVQKYDENAHFEINRYIENDSKLVAYVWR